MPPRGKGFGRMRHGDPFKRETNDRSHDSKEKRGLFSRSKKERSQLREQVAGNKVDVQNSRTVKAIMERNGIRSLRECQSFLRTEDVMRAQHILFYRYNLNDANGDYGDSTKRAVIHFQATNGLQVDGDLGPQTFRALMAQHGGKSTQLGAKMVYEEEKYTNAELLGDKTGRKEVFRAVLREVGIDPSSIDTNTQLERVFDVLEKKDARFWTGVNNMTDSQIIQAFEGRIDFGADRRALKGKFILDSVARGLYELFNGGAANMEKRSIARIVRRMAEKYGTSAAERVRQIDADMDQTGKSIDARRKIVNARRILATFSETDSNLGNKLCSLLADLVGDADGSVDHAQISSRDERVVLRALRRGDITDARLFKSFSEITGHNVNSYPDMLRAFRQTGFEFNFKNFVDRLEASMSVGELMKNGPTEYFARYYESMNSASESLGIAPEELQQVENMFFRNLDNYIATFGDRRGLTQHQKDILEKLQTPGGRRMFWENFKLRGLGAVINMRDSAKSGIGGSIALNKLFSFNFGVTADGSLGLSVTANPNIKFNKNFNVAAVAGVGTNGLIFSIIPGFENNRDHDVFGQEVFENTKGYGRIDIPLSPAGAMVSLSKNIEGEIEGKSEHMARVLESALVGLNSSSDFNAQLLQSTLYQVSEKAAADMDPFIVERVVDSIQRMMQIRGFDEHPEDRAVIASDIAESYARAFRRNHIIDNRGIHHTGLSFGWMYGVPVFGSMWTKIKGKSELNTVAQRLQYGMMYGQQGNSLNALGGSFAENINKISVDKDGRQILGLTGREDADNYYYTFPSTGESALHFGEGFEASNPEAASRINTSYDQNEYVTVTVPKGMGTKTKILGQMGGGELLGVTLAIFNNIGKEWGPERNSYSGAVMRLNSLAPSESNNNHRATYENLANEVDKLAFDEVVDLMTNPEHLNSAVVRTLADRIRGRIDAFRSYDDMTKAKVISHMAAQDQLGNIADLLGEGPSLDILSTLMIYETKDLARSGNFVESLHDRFPSGFRELMSEAFFAAKGEGLPEIQTHIIAVLLSVDELKNMHGDVQAYAQSLGGNIMTPSGLPSFGDDAELMSKHSSLGARVDAILGSRGKKYVVSRGEPAEFNRDIADPLMEIKKRNPAETGEGIVIFSATCRGTTHLYELHQMFPEITIIANENLGADNDTNDGFLQNLYQGKPLGSSYHLTPGTGDPGYELARILGRLNQRSSANLRLSVKAKQSRPADDIEYIVGDVGNLTTLSSTHFGLFVVPPKSESSPSRKPEKPRGRDDSRIDSEVGEDPEGPRSGGDDTSNIDSGTGDGPGGGYDANFDAENPHANDSSHPNSGGSLGSSFTPSPDTPATGPGAGQPGTDLGPAPNTGHSAGSRF